MSEELSAAVLPHNSSFPTRRCAISYVERECVFISHPDGIDFIFVIIGSDAEERRRLLPSLVVTTCIRWQCAILNHVRLRIRSILKIMSGRAGRVAYNQMIYRSH